MTLSNDQLNELNSGDPQPGKRYRHFKGGLYEVIARGLIEGTRLPMVVYRTLDLGVSWVWIRPLGEFTGAATVDGIEVPRFAPEPDEGEV